MEDISYTQNLADLMLGFVKHGGQFCVLDDRVIKNVVARLSAPYQSKGEGIIVVLGCCLDYTYR